MRAEVRTEVTQLAQVKVANPGYRAVRSLPAMLTDVSAIAPQSSKEEADMAYSAFLLQSSNIATQAQDKPSEA